MKIARGSAAACALPIAAVARARAIVLGELFVAIGDISMLLVVVAVRPGAAKTAAPPRARFLPAAAKRRASACSSALRCLI